MRSMINRDGRQVGIVSLMVTLVMMIVITLIVLGFAEIARNEQRSSLDDQLSTQAYYAAESGVNDVRAIIDNDVKTGKAPTDNGQCALQGEYASLNSTVDSTHNASYTCVLVDTHPDTLSYSIGYTSTVIPLLSSGPAFTSFALSWTASGTGVGGCFPTGTNPNTFPDTGSWGCPAPVVRVDLLDANGGSFTRNGWNANTETTFFVPFNSNSVANNGSLGDRGNAVGARCTADAAANTTTCVANICRDPSCGPALGGTQYYARITTLYQDNVSLSINAGGTQFVGAQAKIDSTGKAQDVLRRVLVAVDLTDSNSHPIPSAAIVSRDSICKRFSVSKTSFQVYDNMTAGGNNNPFCDQASTNGSPTP